MEGTRKTTAEERKEEEECKGTQREDAVRAASLSPPLRISPSLYLHKPTLFFVIAVCNELHPEF